MWQVVYFTQKKWKIRLDKKNRIVIPLEARGALGITPADSVAVALNNNGELVLTKSEFGGNISERISRNHYMAAIRA